MRWAVLAAARARLHIRVCRRSAGAGGEACWAIHLDSCAASARREEKPTTHARSTNWPAPCRFWLLWRGCSRPGSHAGGCRRRRRRRGVVAAAFFQAAGKDNSLSLRVSVGISVLCSCLPRLLGLSLKKKKKKSCGVMSFSVVVSSSCLCCLRRSVLSLWAALPATPPCQASLPVRRSAAAQLAVHRLGPALCHSIFQPPQRHIVWFQCETSSSTKPEKQTPQGLLIHCLRAHLGGHRATQTKPKT